MGIIPPGGIPRTANLEIAAALAALALALAGAAFGWRWLGWWERPLARLARRKRLAIVAVALAPLAFRLALLPWFPPPQPQAHDEFSLLLAADTFAHGRLVNPPHPFWASFETMHVLSRPVYASAFPIGLPLLMALGQAALGQPWAGVALAVALMCGAVCWCLQGWLRPKWALLGAALVALRLGVACYWMNSYWGGAAAAAAGALALGAVPRLARKPSWSNGLTMALGLAWLLHTRPYEGCFFGLLCLAALAYLWKTGPLGGGAPLWSSAAGRHAVLRRAALPLALGLAVLGAASGYYFYRVTGSPVCLPYALDRAQMAYIPHFIWQKPGAPPLYNNAEIRGFYTLWEPASYQKAQRLGRDLVGKVSTYWRFYAGPLLILPLALAWALRRRREARLALLLAAAFALALAPEVWHLAHYAAPATALLMLLTVLGLRGLRASGGRLGKALARAIPPACALALALQTWAGPPPAAFDPQSSLRWPPVDPTRTAVVRRLQAAEGAHLVFVRYALAHDAGEEWVYNAANIDASRVVWARELDWRTNQALAHYYSGRHVWLAEPDAAPPRLTPYAAAMPRPMPFVALGAPGIAVLQDAARLRHDLLQFTGPDLRPRSCDAWNFAFAAHTGVAGPAYLTGCRTPGGSAVDRTFDQWWQAVLQAR